MARNSIAVDGSKIRALREQAALERKELAQLVGVTPTSMYRIEVWSQHTSPTNLRKIALALRVPPAELLAKEQAVS